MRSRILPQKDFPTAVLLASKTIEKDEADHAFVVQNSPN